MADANTIAAEAQNLTADQLNQVQALIDTFAPLPAPVVVDASGVPVDTSGDHLAAPGGPASPTEVGAASVTPPTPTPAPVAVVEPAPAEAAPPVEVPVEVPVPEAAPVVDDEAAETVERDAIAAEIADVEARLQKLASDEGE